MTADPFPATAPTAPGASASTVTPATTPGTTAEADVVRSTAGNGPLAVALAAMFVLPWLVWGSAIAQGHGLIGWRLPQGIALWVLTPSIVVAMLLIGGRPALKDLVRRVVRWRAPVWVHAAALAVPVVIGATTVAVTTAAGRPSHLGQTDGLAGCALYFCLAIGLFLLTEEAGWAGMLQPRLQARMRPLAASIVLGLVWGLWHLPLLHVPGASDQGLPLAAFLLLIVPTRVVMSALVNAARGSVVVAAVFHAAFDAMCVYVGVVGSDHAVIWTAAAVTTLAALAVVAATRARRPHPVRPTA